MRQITINGTGYPLPENWLDITIGQLQDIILIDQNKDITDLDKQALKISTVTGIPEDLLDDIPYTEYLKIGNAISFIDRSYPEKTTPTWTHMGVDYTFNGEFGNISTAEFIDYDSLQKRGISELHTLMAILYRPTLQEGEKYKYDVDEVRKRANLFKAFMPASVALSAAAFTLVLGQIYAASSPAYSLVQQEMEKHREMMELTQTLKTHILNNGDGEFLSSKLQETI